MLSMKRVLTIIVLMISFLPLRAEKIELSPKAEISVLTCSPGPDILQYAFKILSIIDGLMWYTTTALSNSQMIFISSLRKVNWIIAYLAHHLAIFNMNI